MRKNNWIIPALVLGFSFFIAIFLIKPIGVSTQFSVISGKIYRPIHDMFSEKPLIQKDDTKKNQYSSTNEYFNKNEGKIAKSIADGIDEDLAFFISIFLGSLIGYLLLSKKNGNKISFINKNISKKELLKSLIGGFLLLFGARTAGGCTSGHMMSGMMQSSISGFVFMIIVFAIAIPVAIGGEKK